VIPDIDPMSVFNQKWRQKKDVCRGGPLDDFVLLSDLLAAGNFDGFDMIWNVIEWKEKEKNKRRTN